MAPACRAYSSFLLAAVYGGSFVEGLAAVLPCYWIYWEVGKALTERGSPHPLYRRWIETYGGEEFAVAVRAALAAMERAAERAAEGERRRAGELFATAARYEWLFWDMGHRQEAWPI
jgi:thiaminase/transcriptional activator TenA